MKNIKILRWNGLSLFYNISNGTYKGALATLVMLTLLTFIACGTPADANADANADADTDGDGTADNIDNCPNDANPNQEDADDDKMGDECDNCPEIANPDQEDTDDDKMGNECDNCQTIANAEQKDMDTDGYGDSCDVDDDGNGLIEIFDSEMLNNIRHNLAGTSYDDEDDDTATAGEDAAGDTTGCGGDVDSNNNKITECRGYELENHIDLLSIPNWIPIGQIGEGATDSDYMPFTATLDGKGYSIQNLTIESTSFHLGFFGILQLGNNSTVQNLRFEGGGITGNRASLNNRTIGSLAGRLVSGRIERVSSNLEVTGSGGAQERLGGLVGEQKGGTIQNTYTTENVNNLGGSDNNVGGLVGRQDGGNIRNSYTTMMQVSNTGGLSQVGGLVGLASGDIRNSYSTVGTVSATGGGNNVGGLGGRMSNGDLRNS